MLHLENLWQWLKKVTNQLAYSSLVIASIIAVNFCNACSFVKNNFPLCIACNRGGVVGFIGEGRVGSFMEDKLLGDRDLDSIVQVRWSEKEILMLDCYFLVSI